MPRGGRVRGPKRKRNWDIKYPSFPGERPLQCREVGLKTVGTVATLSEAWLRCGEGFQDTSETLLYTTKKKTVTEEHLELSSRPNEESSTSKSETVSADLTWNFSGSHLSDEDKILYKSQNDNGCGYEVDRFCNKNSVRPEDDGASEDDLQFIDWEIDSDREDVNECNEFEEGESAVEISDCVSCASSCSLTNEEKLSELPKTSSTEILEYSSESEKEDYSENSLFIDSESPHKYDVNFGSNVEQVMERVLGPCMNSSETVLYTSQKQTEKFRRTPEDSAKKKKLIRGGLAERLNSLQNRERSAISFWRHRCVSYQKSGRNSGVLIVRILEMHEECTMQVALCEQLARQQISSPDQSTAPNPIPRACLKVLFTRETASHLKGHPQDIIHIYPPWQKLIIPDGSCPVILNTYFCQKVGAKEDSELTQEVHCQDTPLPRRIITLHQMFRFPGLTDNSPKSQSLPSCTRCLWAFRRSARGEHHVEGQAVGREAMQAGRFEGPTEGHQRTDGGALQFDRHHMASSDTAESPRPRPVLGRAHPNLGQIDVIEEDPISKLYQPAVPHCLREILQADDVGTRCSFYAQVIYQRPQLRSFPSLEQRDIWLIVTDLTLQMEDESESGLPKTVPVQVAPSCRLGPDVLGALTKAPYPSIFFRDALREQGWIVCVERTVLFLQKPPLCVTSGACSSELTGPVKLDELDSVTQANSICIVQGTVVGVDESTAFSWPSCDQCGNGRLEQSPEDRGAFHCGQCSCQVTSPVLRRHLQIFLDCPSRPQCTVKVKLSQRSIASLLNSAAGDDGSYEVKSVLGKEVGLLNCFVRSITTHPASCIGLEEIELLSSGKASEEHPWLPEYL